jgi:signal transduction histidine kinase
MPDPRAEMQKPEATTPACILVVDDDVGLLRLVEKALKHEGFATATASSGSDAIAWLSEKTAALMLLDLKLPDIEGKELIGHLAGVERSVPFIIITGQGDERVAVDMMKRGALDYLVKDVQFIEFVPTVVKRALTQVEKDKRLALAEKQTQQLQKQILEVSECEQRRIGRDLHDGLGQHLTALELLGQALVGRLKTAAPELVKPAQEITRHIRETITRTRLLSHNLSPVALEADGLMFALSELAAGTEAMTGIKCKYLSDESVLVPDTNAATHLYRIAQEAVNNALKHSRAQEIAISLTEQDGLWRMSVKDDGRGLSPGSKRHSGLGLRMMKYRAQLIGAALDINSAPNKGVQITCTLRKPS